MLLHNVRPKTNFIVEETLQTALNQKIDAFISDETKTTLSFPATLTHIDRGYIHTYAAKKGLKSKSTGNGAERRLTICKWKETTILDTPSLNLPPNSRKLVHNYLKENPLTECEKQSLQSSTNRIKEVKSFGCTLATTNIVSIIVPPATNNPQAEQQRKSLPIYAYRQQIIETIDQNQVIVISGDTGSGKTTQVPQYLLEAYQERQQPCRIICIQPRRIAAISIATRVAFERGERLGDAIGYQVRLESQLSPKSNVVFTTSSYLVRCLVSGNTSDMFMTTTHIILDDVHERDKYTDFLLICIKDTLNNYPNLKIILMSSTIDSNVFINYFDGRCLQVHIPGRIFNVKVYHLEEMLVMLGYANRKFREMTANSAAPGSNEIAMPSEQQQTTINPEMVQYLNSILEDCTKSENAAEAFEQFYYLVAGESAPIDFKHNATRMTALMIAAAIGNLTAVKTLIQMGSNYSLADINNRNAYVWAVEKKRLECAAFLLPFNLSQDPQAVLPLLLQEYQSKTNEADIDHNILFSLIRYIHRQMPAGAILVFLPGYDAIVEQHEIITNYISTNEMDDNVSIFMLHENMPASEQKLVFKPVGSGIRKIILSTSIAETSLTIEDVVYVIDSGKAMQKSLHASTGVTSLTSTFISQESAKQRMGRAGRVQHGICFRLYSTFRHHSMDPFTLPELLRVPLTHVSLHAKFLANDDSIAEFLNKAIQPPLPFSVTQSVKLLQKIGALDDFANVTELGAHLLDLPIDVQLGKALIYAVLLKCLDPVLTIVSALSVKDPFVLSYPGGGETYNKKTREFFSEDTFSDHVVLLKVFQAWNEARASNTDRQFCRDNFVSNGTMQMICGIRSQLLSHLRSTDFIQHRPPGNIHELNKNSACWAVVKAALTAGLFPNVCRIDRKQGQLKSSLDVKLIPHSSSVLHDQNSKKCQEKLRALPSDWMIYVEASRAGRFCALRCTTQVSPLNIALMAGPIFMPEGCVQPRDNDSDSENEDDCGAPNNSNCVEIKVDDRIQFAADEDSAYYIFVLRQKLSAIMLRIIQNPTKPLQIRDTQCVTLVVQLLQNEDRHLKFPQVRNVGKCPLAVKPAFSRGSSYGQQEISGGYNNQSIKENWRSNHQTPENFQGNWRLNQSQHQILPRKQFPAPQQTQFQSSYKQLKPMHIFKPQQTQPTFKQEQLQPAYKNQQFLQSNTPEIVSAPMKSAPNRYFIVKAVSKEQIQQLYLSGTWSFSQSALTKFLDIQRTCNACIIIFFYIPWLQEFFNVAKFLSGRYKFDVTPITHAKLSASVVRNILPQNPELLRDVEEIPENFANLLLHQFNQ